MSKANVYSGVPDDDTAPTKEALVQESRWSTKKRILIALVTMMFMGGMAAIIIDDECGHHDHHHDRHPHHYHHHHHSKRNGVKGYYLWVPDDNTAVVDDEDDVYCNEHEWCLNAKAWFKAHVDSEESMTDADSSSSDSNDSNESDFVAYLKNSQQVDEDGLEVEELPSLTETENVQEKTEGLRGGKIIDGGN